MPSNLNRHNYSNYQEWKKWGRLFVYNESQRRYFEHEFSGIDFSGKQLLEIGFGDGSFLSWAQSQGAHVVGCELIEPICSSGIAQGYDTRFGDVRTAISPAQESFDLVIAFDVLEHILPDDLLDFLKFIGGVMKPNSLFIVRVPNGQSPFGLVNQYGDITHVNVLSKGRFEQLAPMAQLEMVYCRNAFRFGKSEIKLIDVVRFKLRDFLNAFITKVYGLEHIPLDQNIVACFKKIGDARHPG